MCQCRLGWTVYSIVSTQQRRHPMRYGHLTQEERYQIHSLLQISTSLRKIAKKTGRNAATVSRELRRNRGRRGYRPKRAQEKYTARMKTAHKHTKMVPGLVVRVEGLLRKNWSPEQVSGRLALEGISISHESIYLHVLRDKKNGGSLHSHLRWQKKRKKRYGTKPHDKRGRIKDRVCIEKRPRAVDEKRRVGDWEGDLIIGRNHKGAMVTLVDRSTKKTKIRMVASKRAGDVAEALESALCGEVVRTITLDNGKEFSAHKSVSAATGAGVYFAHPYSSWERGLNENTNGLIRQYFPKKSDFSLLGGSDVRAVEDALNARPRKSLGYLTPNEAYARKAALAKRYVPV